MFLVPFFFTVFKLEKFKLTNLPWFLPTPHPIHRWVCQSNSSFLLKWSFFHSIFSLFLWNYSITAQLLPSISSLSCAPVFPYRAIFFTSSTYSPVLSCFSHQHPQHYSHSPLCCWPDHSNIWTIVAESRSNVHLIRLLFLDFWHVAWCSAES